MNIERTATITLENSNEVEQVHTLASIALDFLNSSLRKEQQWCGMSFSEMQDLVRMGDQLRDL